ncbi:MAG: spore cortex biosynthesis protein YabQ [Clostridiaceae bacterium]|jgi:spore cortex biosynthesis protein YabQ|nr:spore cortex biosynthesis protein YabQ [Clostridiaceae bacterium]
MILSVSEQVIVFLWTTVCGMAAAFVYDLFRIFRKAVKTGSLVTFVQDVLYWLIVAVIMSITVFYSNDGELRGFLFLGAFIGAVLYALMFSRVIMSSSLFIIKVTVKTIKIISFIVSYPFRMLLRLIAIPARKLAEISASEIRKAREKSRANKERARAEKAIRAAARAEKSKSNKANRPKADNDKTSRVKLSKRMKRKVKSILAGRVFSRKKRKISRKASIL